MKLMSALWRRAGRGLFRAVAICACMALCALGLTATPAHATPGDAARAGLGAAGTAALRPAAATVNDPVNPGGDFTASMPFGGVPSATMSQIVSTTFPEALGLSANPTLTTLVTAVYQQMESGGGSGAVAPPPTFAGGTITVTTTVTGPVVTVTVPASQVPASNSPGGPRGPLASWLSALLTALAASVAYGFCVFSTGFRNGTNQISDAQKYWCLAFSALTANVMAYSLNDDWGGTAPTGSEWAKIFTFAVVSVAGAVLSAKWVSPWIEESVLTWGGELSGWLGTLIATKAPWIGTGWAAVKSFVQSMIVNQPTPSTVGVALGTVGLATPVAAGSVLDDEIPGAGSECMDAYGASGTPVGGDAAAINTCNGGPDQYWTQWSNNTLSNGGMCLDITGNPWGWGAPLELYQCNGQSNQEWKQSWTFLTNRLVYNPGAGLCVDDPNWDTAPGTQLKDANCTGTTAQRWLLPGTGTATGPDTFPIVTNWGPVDSGLSGECVDAYGSSDGASPGQTVAINNCNGNQAQDWTVWSDGTVRAWNLCMDASGAGAQVQLEGCDGAASQVWTSQPDGELTSSASGLCLQDPGATTTPGTQLVLATCNDAPDQQWKLPPAPPGQTPPPPPSQGSACDLYAYYGTPCVGAYSMDRALYSAYDGPLYQVQRASDGTTANIGLLTAGGDVDAAAQDTFCASTTCTITEIYDQSPQGNNLTIEGPGGNGGQDHGAVANALPIKIGGHEAYGLDIEPGTGYRDNATHGVAVNGEPEGMYMVASGTHVNSGCCFDFGNAETDSNDNGAGHMDAVNLTTWCGSNSAPCTGSGPWVEADLENGQWMGDGSNPGEQGNSTPFVTAVLKNNGTNAFELQGGDSTSGGLSKWYNGPLPPGYTMRQEGAIVLGTGGDNSNSDVGSFFEGVMTQGFPSDAADAAVQADIVAVGYSGSTNPIGGAGGAGGAAPSAAGQAVVHAAGATGAGASGFSSVYTVNSANGHLQETYLPYMGASWTTQDLSALSGTPPVMPGTQPVALVHCGYTSVYTVDATNGDLQETYLPAIGQSWTTQDLSVNYGTPPTDVTPTAVVHAAGATGAAAACGFTSVYTVDAANGDLQETYLPAIGDPWTTQDLSAAYGTPTVQAGTSPVAIVHCGFTSVYTVDADHQLQETYLPAIGDPWTTQSLSANYGTPLTTTTPTAVVHTAGATGAAAACGFTSVYTVDQSGNDLQETYLPVIGGPWATQNLSAAYGTPTVAPGTQPAALVHTGYTSVYTVDAGSDHVQETYLSNIGNSWATQDLSAKYGTAPTAQTPVVLLHPDASGNLTWTSVYTVGQFDDHLEETYLPAIGDAWTTQDLSAKYGTPPVAATGGVPTAGSSVAHDGYASVYSVDTNGDLQETYLTAIGKPWATQDLSARYGTPAVMPGSTAVALTHAGFTSVYTLDAGDGHLQETYLTAIGQPWATQDLSARYGTPAAAPGTSPAAVFHNGYVSVYTVDAGDGHLQETYLSNIGNSWATQDLSAKYGTPAVDAFTSPAAVLHSGYVSVYTVDASNEHLQETYLPAINDPWTTQDLSASYGTPAVDILTSPAAVVHDGYTSVYTVDSGNGHLQETYLPAVGDPWATQDLSARYGTPAAESGDRPEALYHTGYTSVYTVDAGNGHLQETYLPAISDPWTTQDLSAKYGTPPTSQPPSVLLHYDASGGLTWTSVFSVDAASNDLQETYLPAINDAWTTYDMSERYGTPPV